MRRHRRHLASAALGRGVAVGGAALAAGAYTGAVILGYRRLAGVGSGCPPAILANTPADFELGSLGDLDLPLDTSRWRMPGFEEVSFPSRDAGIALRAWWVPAAPDAPAIVVIHGARRCRHDPLVLLLAGMLHRRGFSVLIPDLRNHGDSGRESGRHSAGIREHRDVLGAWDWLHDERGIAAERIGLLGISLGGGAATIAIGAEPRVAATWIDGVFADMRIAMDDEARRGGLPSWLVPGGAAIVRRFSGIDFRRAGPLASVPAIAGRPFFIAHGADDARISVRHADVFAEAFAAAGAPIEPWIIPATGHCLGPITVPDEYEARLAAFFSGSIGAPAIPAPATP